MFPSENCQLPKSIVSSMLWWSLFIIIQAWRWSIPPSWICYKVYWSQRIRSKFKFSTFETQTEIFILGNYHSKVSDEKLKKFGIPLEFFSNIWFYITLKSFDKRASFIFVGTKCGKVAFYSVKDLRVMWFNHNKDSEFGEIKSLFFQEPENDPKRNGWVWQCAQRDDNLLQLELYSLGLHF